MSDIPTAKEREAVASRQGRRNPGASGTRAARRMRSALWLSEPPCDSHGTQHVGLWEALAERRRSIEVVAVVRTDEEFDRAQAVLELRATAPGLGEGAGDVSAELARIERAILRGTPEVLAEFGGLQARLEAQCRAREAGAPPARNGSHPARQHLPDDASGGGALPMTARHVAPLLECANDAGGNAHLDRSEMRTRVPSQAATPK